MVATEGAFHGRTMGALALTAKEAYREPFEPLPGGVTFVPYGDADALAAAVTDETAAVILEPLQGEAGVVAPPLRLPGPGAGDHRASTARCCGSTRSRPASAAPAPGTPTRTPPWQTRWTAPPTS